ncbi:MAG TPA: saccharopine dehydrogenase NADP-binding domain-containing protein [Solirubrobacterales bacterium]|nr:saccharopine dehydrogenase NADP-binding domain-containing protein [Solirubrobacterales bacterium]
MSDPPHTRIALVGAGEMGRAALGIIARRLPGARFRVFDQSESHLLLARELAPDRISVTPAEIGPEALPDLGDSEVVLNCAGPFYLGSDAIARAALAAGITYLDICDDVEGARAILALDEEAKRAGVALITGAGNSPGTSNVMGKRLLELHPECDGIRVVWVVRDSDPGGLAPLRHMLHMAVETCPVWDEGRLTETAGFVPKTARAHQLPEPVGHVVAFDTAHPEPLTMSRALPRLRHVSVQGALQPAWANDAFSTLGRIGFGYPDLRVEVNGAEVQPDEVLWKLLWARHRKRAGDSWDEKPGMTCVQVQALRGEEIVATMSVYDDHSMLRTTGIGAAAATLAALAATPPPGAWGTEVLEAEAFLDLVAELAAAEGALPDGIVEGGAARPAADNQA